MGAAPDPPLTELQARVLFELCQRFLQSGPTAGMRYDEMIQDSTIAASSIPMLKKTIRQLRMRSKPLVDSHTESLGTFPKGRRPDVFTINPDNIVTDEDTAYLIFHVHWTLRRGEYSLAKDDLEYLVFGFMEKEYCAREGPDYANLEFHGRGDLSEIEEAAMRMFEPARPQIESLILEKLEEAFKLGYLTEQPGRGVDLRLSAKAHSELAYLMLHYRMYEPPPVKFRPEEPFNPKPGTRGYVGPDEKTTMEEKPAGESALPN
jgi:hypothetical protein